MFYLYRRYMIRINVGCGFKYFSISPLFGEMIQFDSYCSKGLVQPPTRNLCSTFPYLEDFFCAFWSEPTFQQGTHLCSSVRWTAKESSEGMAVWHEAVIKKLTPVGGWLFWGDYCIYDIIYIYIFTCTYLNYICYPVFFLLCRNIWTIIMFHLLFNIYYPVII